MKRRQALKIRKRLVFSYYKSYQIMNHTLTRYKQSTKDKSWNLFWSLPNKQELSRTFVEASLRKLNKSCKHNNQ